MKIPGVEEETRRRVILADVAREVGVSTATVSYVLNDSPGHTISAETQRRVLSVATKLGYERSIGRGFRRSRAEIAVLDASTFAPGSALSSAAGAFTRCLRDSGLTVIVHCDRSAEPTLTELVDAVAPVAVVSMGHSASTVSQSLRGLGIRHLATYDFSVLSGGKGWDHALGAEQVLHLAARGHRCIAFAHPDDARLRDVSQLRAAGAREAGEAFDLTGLIEFVSPDDDIIRLHVLAKLRAQHPALTAVAAYDDATAIGVIFALHQTGLPLPGGMAVMGADEIPFARHSVPALTTLRVDARRTGERMAKNLLHAMKGESLFVGDVEPEISVVSRASA